MVTIRDAQRFNDVGKDSFSRGERIVLTEDRIIAVEICSTVLQAHIWLAFSDDFDPGDGQAVFYAHELEFLKTKTPEELRYIHETKVNLGLRYKVRQ